MEFRLIKKLLKEAGVTFNPIELIDFYHAAAQHLYEFAGLKRSWSKKQVHKLGKHSKESSKKR